MTAKSLKEQYQDCYRIARLIQQALATYDFFSLTDLTIELKCYDEKAVLFARNTWANRLGAWCTNGTVDYDVLRAWREQYRQKELSQ
jgi:hypothetical protein